MVKTFIMLSLLLVVSACSAARDDLKSPCVGLEESPCGPKRSVNDKWVG
jgi:Tfp pilus assembly protein PilP